MRPTPQPQMLCGDHGFITRRMTRPCIVKIYSVALGSIVDFPPLSRTARTLGVLSHVPLAHYNATTRAIARAKDSELVLDSANCLLSNRRNRWILLLRANDHQGTCLVGSSDSNPNRFSQFWHT